MEASITLKEVAKMAMEKVLFNIHFMVLYLVIPMLYLSDDLGQV